MKNKVHIPNGAFIFFLLTLALAFFSWIGSVYGVGEVQSLLSAEGIRWMLGHIVDNYVRTPALGIVMVLLMGVGIAIRAGLYDVLKRLGRKEVSLSRKERRALTLASAVGVLYGGMVGASLLLPRNFLLGVTGSLLHSPFAEGAVYLLSIGIGLSGVVYGYATDTFRRVADVFEGMSCLIARWADYFVTLFFVVQFFSSLSYTRMALCAGISEEMVTLAFYFCCLVPLLAHTRAHENNNV